MEFDQLYLELIDSTNMIKAVLQGISEEDARIKPDADTWSVLETLCHLHDEEREDFREHLDFALHQENREWRRTDQDNWRTSRRYNEQSFREMKEKFFGERSKSLDWLRGLSHADWDVSCTTPWRPLTAGEIFVSWIAHDNLHLRQLVELRRARIERISKPYSLTFAGDW